MKEKTKVVSLLDKETKESIKKYFGIDVDSKLLSPTTDYVFKRLFTADEKRSKLALIDFLNSVLESDEKIVDLTVINPQIPVDSQESKKSIFDVRVIFNDGKQAIIEMQLAKEHDFRKRSQFIISKAYVSQPISGLHYAALKKCYLICITNFILLSDKEELVNDYCFRDKSGDDLSDEQTIIFIELPKLDKVLNKQVNEMTNLEMWSIFFKYSTDDSKSDILNQIIKREEGIRMGASILEELSKSEQERIKYESELIFELDYRSGLYRAMEDGEKKGKLEGKLETAKAAIELGLNLEQVSKITGLSIDEIKNIK